MRAARGTDPQGSADSSRTSPSPRPQTSSFPDDETPGCSGKGQFTSTHFLDLSDDVILNILRDLPEEDAQRAAKASWRLHMLLLLQAPGSHLRLDARVTPDDARELIRKTPRLKCLELRYRADTDALLTQVARNCPEIETLSLIGCQGDVNSRGLSAAPLMSIARSLKKLRALYLRSTKFRSIAAIKYWSSHRAPGEPPLFIRFDSLGPKLLEQLGRLQETPEDQRYITERPHILRVDQHRLHFCHETPQPLPETPLAIAEETSRAVSTSHDKGGDDHEEVAIRPNTEEDPEGTAVTNNPLIDSWFTNRFIGTVTETTPPSIYLEPPSDLQVEFTTNPDSTESD